MRGATVVRGGRRILDNIDLTIREGEHIALLGPNGSGKSSFIKLLTRQYYPLAPESGSPPPMRLFGEAFWDVATLRSLLGIVSADQHHTFTSGPASESITATEAVLSGFFGGIGLASHHRVTDEMRDRAREALAWMEASQLARKPMGEMSTGEARRVLIARALVPDPRALLLDEPTTGLDLASMHRFLETVRAVIGRGKTVLLVTHHVEEIVPEIDRVILLREGRIFADGPKPEVLTSPSLSHLFDEPVHVSRSLRPGYYEARVTDT